MTVDIQIQATTYHQADQLKIITDPINPERHTNDDS